MNVNWNSAITGNTFDHLPEDLQELECWRCTLTDEAVAALSARCTKLLKLNVNWNSAITGNTFDHLPKDLQELECRECALTDKAVAALSARCTKLLKLNVSWNSRITGNAFITCLRVFKSWSVGGALSPMKQSQCFLLEV